MRLGHFAVLSGLQPALEAAARGLTKLSVSAYVDDVVAVGPIDQAATFFDRLSSLSPDLGLSLSLSKSSLLWPSSESPPDPSYS